MPWPRRLDRRFAKVFPLTVGLMMIGLAFATRSEIVAYGNGDLINCWQLIAFLLMGAVVCGMSLGVMERVKLERDDIVLTFSQSAWGAYARTLASVVTRWLIGFAANSLRALPAGAPLLIEHHRVYKPLPFLSHDYWPSGSKPLISYH